MKRPKPPKIVVVLIFTTITIIFWVFLSVYEVLRKNPNLNIPDAVLKPLTPTLNAQVLNKLSNRTYYSEDDLNNIAPQVQPTPTVVPDLTGIQQQSSSSATLVTPTLSPTPTSSASATPSP